MLSWTPLVVAATTLALSGCGGHDERPAAPRTTHFSLNDIDVVGLSSKAAEAKLRAAGWSVEDSSYRAYGYRRYLVIVPEDPGWTICSQRFSTMIDGTRSLSLEAGPTCGEVEMPDLIGKSYSDAQQAVAKLGLTLLEDHMAFGPDAGGAVGAVCLQSLPPGPFILAEQEGAVYVELGC